MCVKAKDIGFAIKIESGSMAVLPPAVIRVLEDLDVLSKAELKALEKYNPMTNTNDLKNKVGEISAVFDLKKV